MSLETPKIHPSQEYSYIHCVYDVRAYGIGLATDR